MKKYLQRLTAFILFMLTIAPIGASAATFKAGEQLRLTETDGDAYLAASVISQLGAITGDAFLAGAMVNVAEDVSDDVFAVGSTVDIDGNIGGDARIGGSYVTIESSVGEDLIVGGSVVRIGPNVEIGGDVLAGGASVELTGDVVGDVAIYAADVFLNGAIGGDVKIEAETITIGENASIAGNFAYASGQEIVIPEGVVSGETVFTQKVMKQNYSSHKSGDGVIIAILAALKAVKSIIFLVTVVVLVLLLPKLWTAAAERQQSGFWKMLLNGLAIGFVLGLGSLILLFTGLGAGLGILGLLSLGMLKMLAKVAAATYLGSWIVMHIWKEKKISVNWWKALLGAVIISILGFIPILGWLVVIMLVLAAFGSISHVIYKATLEKWR